MEAIKKFYAKENYGTRAHRVEMYKSEMGTYIILVKYASIEKKELQEYTSLELANYNYIKKVMFLLS